MLLLTWLMSAAQLSALGHVWDVSIVNAKSNALSSGAGQRQRAKPYNMAVE